MDASAFSGGRSGKPRRPDVAGRSAPAALCPREDPHRERIARYRRRLARKRQEVLELTLQLERLEQQLRRFEHEYHARVGHLFLELDRVQLKIKQLLYKARLLERGWIRDPDRLERQVEAAFRTERQRLQTKDRFESRASEWEASATKEAPKPSQSIPADRSLRKLYLALAKQYHPDKAPSGLRAQYEEIMALVNRAYTEGDRERLEHLAATLDRGEVPADDPVDVERWIYREFVRLERVRMRLRRRLERFRSRELYRLMCEVQEAKQRGVDLLEELHRELVRRVRSAHARLSDVQGQCQRLWGQWFGAPAD